MINTSVVEGASALAAEVVRGWISKKKNVCETATETNS
jgi:hypothetical protein